MEVGVGGKCVLRAARDKSVAGGEGVRLWSTNGGPSPPRFLHEWIRAFLVLAGALRHGIFPPIAAMKESYFTVLLPKLDLQKSLEYFMQTTYSQAQSTTSVRLK